MKGLGKATLSQLLQAGLVRCAADLYDLEARQLESLKGFKAKRAAGCVSAIRKSKGAAMSVILSALGIPLVGHKAAQALQAEFGTMEALSAASVKELTAVKGVGPKIAGSVRDWFSKDPNRVHVARLMAAGVVQEEPKVRPPLPPAAPPPPPAHLATPPLRPTTEGRSR